MRLFVDLACGVWVDLRSTWAEGRAVPKIHLWDGTDTLAAVYPVFQKDGIRKSRLPNLDRLSVPGRLGSPSKTAPVGSRRHITRPLGSVEQTKPTLTAASPQFGGWYPGCFCSIGLRMSLAATSRSCRRYARRSAGASVHACQVDDVSPKPYTLNP